MGREAHNDSDSIGAKNTKSPLARCQRAFCVQDFILTEVLHAGLGSFAQHDLDAVVAGLSGSVRLTATNNFAIGRHMVEAVLAGTEEEFEALGLAIGLNGLDAVFAAGFGGVAFAGLHDFAVIGTQVVPILAAALEYLEGCHLKKEGVKRMVAR
jgi:hypothetical protein